MRKRLRRCTRAPNASSPCCSSVETVSYLSLLRWRSDGCRCNGLWIFFYVNCSFIKAVACIKLSYKGFDPLNCLLVFGQPAWLKSMYISCWGSHDVRVRLGCENGSCLLVTIQTGSHPWCIKHKALNVETLFDSWSSWIILMWSWCLTHLIDALNHLAFSVKTCPRGRSISFDRSFRFRAHVVYREL